MRCPPGAVEDISKQQLSTSLMMRGRGRGAGRTHHETAGSGRETAETIPEGDVDDVPEVEVPAALLEYKRDADAALKPKEHSRYELEVRYVHPAYAVNARLFHATKEAILKRWSIPPVEEVSTVVNYPQNLRTVTVANQRVQTEYKRELGDPAGRGLGDDERSAATGEQAAGLSAYLSRSYPYKVALSEERPATPEERSLVSRLQPVRTVERVRTSYALSRQVRIDCTVSTETRHRVGGGGGGTGGGGRNERPSTTYRIELEVTDATIDAETLRDDYVAPLLRLVLESPILVTLQTLQAIRRSPPFLNDTRFSTRPVPPGISVDKPEDLRFYELSSSTIGEDLTRGGLLTKERYCVTIKTDGVRRLLLVFRDSVYLVGVHSGNTWSFSRVYRRAGGVLPLHGTLIDGELLDDYGEGRTFYDPDAVYTYWAFDVVAYRAPRKTKSAQEQEIIVSTALERQPNPVADQPDIFRVFMVPGDEVGVEVGGGTRADGEVGGANDAYTSRLSILQRLCGQIRWSRLSLNCKHFTRCDGASRFFAACKETLEAEYPFGTDGLIFTNMDAPYTTTLRGNLGGWFNVSYNRKWKPRKKLTVDLLYRDGRLWAADREIEGPDKITPFRGVRGLEWDGRFEDTYEGERLKDGQIMEFAYLSVGEVQDEDEDAEEDNAELPKRLVPIRPRNDKDMPSSVKAAGDVWRLLYNPIRQATLKGESYQLMRKYHNGVKRGFLGELQANTRDLDVGIGQGGDMLEQYRLGLRVVGLEVNPQQIMRFEQRLAALKRQERGRWNDNAVVVEMMGGQDPRVRQLGTFDVATLFFVITFFRGDDLVALIDNLAAVVKDGGRVYLTGFDARRFASFLPGYEEALAAAEGKVEDISFRYDSPATIFELNGPEVGLHLRGTLVGTEHELQLEYAVEYDEVVRMMEERGFHVDENAFLTEEDFLGQDESWYTRSTRLIRLSRGVRADVGGPVASTSLEELALPGLPAVNLIRYTMDDEGAEGEGGGGEEEEEDGLLPSPDGLAAGETLELEYLGYDLERLGVLGDGNCLLHAVCQSISDQYPAMTDREKTLFVRELRQDLADNVDESTFDELGGGSVKALYGTLERFRAHLKRWRKYRGRIVYEWLGEEVLDLLERTFSVEIIMLWYTRKNGMIPGIGARTDKDYRRSIILLNLGNAHYESVGLRSEGEVWTLFDATHTLIDVLRRRSASWARERELERQRGRTRDVPA
jgi:SAM-dependent methyltransferase